MDTWFYCFESVTAQSIMVGLCVTGNRVGPGQQESSETLIISVVLVHKWDIEVLVGWDGDNRYP